MDAMRLASAMAACTVSLSVMAANSVMATGRPCKRKHEEERGVTNGMLEMIV